MENNTISLQFGAQPTVDNLQINDTNQQIVNDITINDSILSETEKQAVDNFSKQIDIKNSVAIMEYGSGVQKKMADFSQKTLDKVRTKDMGEVGTLLTDVVAEVKKFNDSTEEKKGLFRKTKSIKNRIQQIKSSYDSTEVNITKICNILESHQVILLKDVAQLDQMYDLNLQAYKEITMYIIAGKKKLDEIRNTELKELRQKAEQSGKPEDAQSVKDLTDQCNRFEKKLYDLDLTRMISMQTAPQIRLLQSTDTQLAEKIQSVIVNTIPLWKNQMVISLGIAHSQAAIEAESAVTNATNELLKANAKSLHGASVSTAKAIERGIVDIETLQQTNQELISTLSEVMEVQENGRKARADAEIELRRMEQELKDKLLNMSKS